MSRLFEPLRVGEASLSNRITLAPLTRFRADDDWVPCSKIVREYYEQRSSVPGTLLVSEATVISKAAAGRKNIPGLWNDAQVAGWKEVVDGVHAKGGFIYAQLWHMGRAGSSDVHRELGTRLLSSSPVPIDLDSVVKVNPADKPSDVPEEMTEEDIRQTIQDYATAAKNAIRAGFDGVEIHGANGYLIDQFTQDTCNQRTDSWGGSIENRARFGLEVAKAVTEAVGSHRTAIRLSPFSTFQSMLMKNPFPQFEYLIKQLKTLNLAYLHLVEPRVSGIFDVNCPPEHDLLPLVKLWDNQSPVMLAGSFTAESAVQAVDGKYKDYNVLIAFGRYFISNPDLVFRVKNGIKFNNYNRDTFYLPKSPEGYTDYPFSKEFLAQAA